MKIYRTIPNKYGWRTKFTLRNDNVLSIVKENNHKGYWCEVKGSGYSTWTYLSQMKNALEYLTEE